MKKERIKALLQVKNHETPLDYFVSTGEKLDPEQWEKIDEREAHEHTLTEDDLHNALPLSLRLASSIPGDSRKGSEHDTSHFKVRYKYSGNQAGQRAFCNRMISADRVYRYEDIEAAEHLPVNPGLGPHGSDTYSIWLFKGGKNCLHYWQRVIYLKKNNKLIGVNEARRMILELDPPERNDAKWKQNDPRVAQIASPSNNHWALTSKHYKQLNITEMSSKERIALALSQAEKTVKLYDGETKIILQGFPPRVGSSVFALSYDGEDKIPLPEGEFELENGEILVVGANSLFVEIKKKTKLSAHNYEHFKNKERVRMSFKKEEQSPFVKECMAIVKNILASKEEPETEDMVSKVIANLQMQKHQQQPVDRSPEAISLRLRTAINNAQKSQ